MARHSTTTAASRLARLEARLAEARRARAGDAGPAVVYADDDDRAVGEYVAERELMGGELVVVVWSLAHRPAGTSPAWSPLSKEPPSAVRDGQQSA